MDNEDTRESWTLTQEALDRLLLRLDPDRERAAVQYETIRRKLIYFFERQGSVHPAEQTDETINRVARKAVEGEEIRAADVSKYFYGVARFVLKEHWRDPRREWTGLDGLVEGSEPTIDPRRIERQMDEADEEERLRSCLNRCLSRLPASNRALIQQYYEGERGVKIRQRRDLAERLKTPLNAVRIRAHRIRLELEACVESCLRDEEA